MGGGRSLAQNEPQHAGSPAPAEVRQRPVEEVTAAPSRLGVVSTGLRAGKGQGSLERPVDSVELGATKEVSMVLPELTVQGQQRRHVSFLSGPLSGVLADLLFLL